ncbi:hypothetical protein B0H11DRAFT_1941037 [Mycena galericulata]|nr:hypothetical protein B0H11DRAFT_1941037 [Mycena galericulata]
MTLEAEKRKVEEELEAERGLALDKDALLEQSPPNVRPSGRSLVRLETEQKEGCEEAELNAQLAEAEQGADAMRADLDELRKVGRLARAKERTDIAVRELEGKLEGNFATWRSSAQGGRPGREWSASPSTTCGNARTATEHSAVMQQKDEQRHQHPGNSTRRRAGRSGDRDGGTHKMQAELDELRKLMEAKTSEATRRAEVEKSKEQELAGLRQETQRLQHDLTDGRRQLLATQKQLKLELDTSVREHAALQESHRSLSERERTAQADLVKTRAALSELERTKRSLNLNSSPYRRARMTGKVTLRMREKRKRWNETRAHRIGNWKPRESNSRANPPSARSWKKPPPATRQRWPQLKERNVQLEADLNKAFSDLKARDLEARQFESKSKQHTTIVEHVYVLEEAKRVTDRQLADAQAELQQSQAYIRSLEKAKMRLVGEAEDLARETERERLELRTREKAAKTQEDRMTKAFGGGRSSCRHAQRSKDQLETDLDRLADDTGEAPVSKARRIAQLEAQIIEAKSSRVSSRYDGDSGDWRKEKERMEAKLADITRAYEASAAAQAEQRAQIGSLHSQVRDLRGVLDDAEADRVLLQKARRRLQAELETIKHDHIDTSLDPADQEKHQLQLKQLELERSLEEQEYRAANSLDRMKKAEAYANECQVELGRVRVDNSELDRLNLLNVETQANLEKQVKELNARIGELESKPANSPRPAVRRESRIEELTNQLQTNKGRR